eukprot:2724220-Pleurochrysis_carterae.AAC.2
MTSLKRASHPSHNGRKMERLGPKYSNTPFFWVGMPEDISACVHQPLNIWITCMAIPPLALKKKTALTETGVAKHND